MNRAGQYRSFNTKGSMERVTDPLHCVCKTAGNFLLVHCRHDRMPAMIFSVAN